MTPRCAALRDSSHQSRFVFSYNLQQASKGASPATPAAGTSLELNPAHPTSLPSHVTFSELEFILSGRCGLRALGAMEQAHDSAGPQLDDLPVDALECICQQLESRNDRSGVQLGPRGWQPGRGGAGGAGEL